MLRDELDARDPDRARAIHAAAARWYQERDDPAAAVEHWLAAGNVTDAMRLFPEVRFTRSDANRDELVRALLANIHPSMGATDVWHLLDYATALVGVDELIASSDVLDHVDAILRLDARRRGRVPRRHAARAAARRERRRRGHGRSSSNAPRAILDGQARARARSPARDRPRSVPAQHVVGSRLPLARTTA